MQKPDTSCVIRKKSCTSSLALGKLAQWKNSSLCSRHWKHFCGQDLQETVTVRQKGREGSSVGRQLFILDTECRRGVSFKTVMHGKRLMSLLNLLLTAAHLGQNNENDMFGSC